MSTPPPDGSIDQDGRIVRWFPASKSAQSGGVGAPTPAARLSDGQRAALAKSQARALRAAAAEGVPFCEECEAARRELNRKARSGR